VLVLLAVGLRGPVSSVGPLLDDLRRDVGLPAAAAALLPSLPLLCFGLLAPVAPLLSRRLGLHRAVLAGSATLVTGVALRSAGAAGLFAGTLLVGAGIAVVNVLLPAVVKADFAGRVPLATAVTTSSIALSASLGAGLAQPLRTATGGALPSLATWLVPALVGLLAWAPLARRSAADVSVPAPGGLGVLLRDRVGLAVTAFFGLQSLAFYTMLAWLPSVLRDAGVSATEAGAMLAVAAAAGIPVAFVVPKLAVRRPDQRRLVVLVALPATAGLLGLLAAPAAAPWLWSVLLGVGTGAAFPLALTLVVLRSRDSAQAARLSATAQGAGYLLCATGPFAIGLVHAATGGWRPSLLVLLGLLALQVVVGRSAARDRFVTG
jgi:CP family cyanate transporter-like MFS transporter